MLFWWAVSCRNSSRFQSTGLFSIHSASLDSVAAREAECDIPTGKSCSANTQAPRSRPRVPQDQFWQKPVCRIVSIDKVRAVGLKGATTAHGKLIVDPGTKQGRDAGYTSGKQNSGGALRSYIQHFLVRLDCQGFHSHLLQPSYSNIDISYFGLATVVIPTFNCGDHIYPGHQRTTYTSVRVTSRINPLCK